MVDAALFGELKTICLRSFPERLGQSVSELQPHGAGRHPTVWFALSWREGGRTRVERLAVRRYADPWTWWSIDDRAKARREWAVMRWLFGLGLPVPPLYASGAAGEQESLLMSRASGQPCADVDALAGLLARVHRLAPPQQVRDVLPRVSVAGERARMEAMVRQCDNADLIQAVELLLIPDVEEYPPCVLHGDPGSDNVLCDARGVTAVLNWEHAALGDPRWDIARVVSELRSIRAHERIVRFEALYRERTESALDDMVYWEALAAVQSWVLAEWVCERADDEGAAPLLSTREAWRARAWHALTRLRYERHRAVAQGEQPATIGP